MVRSIRRACPPPICPELGRPALEAQPIELVQRQAEEGTYSVQQRATCLRERLALLIVAATDCGGVRDAPMGRHRLPGQTGQTSPAALSQTVKMKSSRGAPGVANSSQLLLRRPSVGK